jgi:glycosyltransferase involved in cell wall biosynthesis
MKILHVFNRHRNGGGADNACDATIRLSREAGIDVSCFERDSTTIAGLRAKAGAFASGIYARRTLQEFAAELERSRPDIVHAHELYPLISPWVLAVCAERGIPVVQACYDFRLSCPIATHARGGRVCTDCIDGNELAAVVHNCRGNVVESTAYALRNSVARIAGLHQRHVRRFIVLTEFSRDWLEARCRIEPERIAINPPAVESAEMPADPTSGTYIGFAGRLVPEKGAELLVEVSRRLGVPLKIAANQASFDAVRPGDPVECMLTPRRSDLIDFYRGARMVVVPSLWFETFALVAAEAMGQGIPVVASRIGALQDTVRDGATGLLFEPGDAGSLMAAIERLWNDNALTRQMGAASARRVKAEFTPDRHIERLVAIYEDVLREPRKRAA